jgi:hypothetical protein
MDSFTSFHLRATSRIPRSCSFGMRWSLWLALMLFVAGPETGAQHSIPVATKASAWVSSSQCNRVIVVGLLGGFVRRDDPQHPEVGLIRELRQEHPTETYFALFENGHIHEAYRSIVRELKVCDGNRVSRSARVNPRIILFGHSWGASAVVRLARKLDRAGIPVALTIQVDSVAKPFRYDAVIPANVSEAVNFYQTHGLVRGRSKIVAADSERTRIIGNFRREYRTEPGACRSFSWYSRVFTKSHIEIECDPDLWLEIRALLERYLPTETVAPRRLEALEPCAPSLDTKFGEIDRIEGVQLNPIGKDTTDGHCCN